MRTPTGMRTRHAVLVAAAAGLLAGGVAVAGATSGPVTVCATTTGAGLRYSSTGICRASETKIVLGSPGATGATGTAGATGAAGGYPSSITVKEINGAHTLVLSDAGKLLYAREFTTLTVPTDASVAFAIGTRIEIVNLKYVVYVTPASGVTINELSSGNIATGFVGSYESAQASPAVLVKQAANTWLLLQPLKET